MHIIVTNNVCKKTLNFITQSSKCEFNRLVYRSKSCFHVQFQTLKIKITRCSLRPDRYIKHTYIVCVVGTRKSINLENFVYKHKRTNQLKLTDSAAVYKIKTENYTKQKRYELIVVLRTRTYRSIINPKKKIV